MKCCSFFYHRDRQSNRLILLHQFLNRFSQRWKFFGIDGPSWISNPDYALETLVALRVWQFGSPMVIFLAGLRQIPTELYEAAAIDGAGPWTQFRRVTLPLLAPVIFFNLILQTIDAFKAFTPAVHGKPMWVVVAFWQQEIASGRTLPPVVCATEEAALQAVSNDPGGVAYVSEGLALLPGVKALTVAP